MIFPAHLREGDKIGVISPAGPPDPEKLRRAAEWLTGLGFSVVCGRAAERSDGYLAGTDDERVEDLHTMFADDSIRAIICSRGGYGSARFADRIDYELIRSHPKIFWGYSDITYLHTAIRQQAGLVTFHGPMLASDLGGEHVPSLSRQLFSQLFQPEILRYDQHVSPLSVICGGSVSGMLVGGNLSLLVSSLGTPFEIDTKNKVLLIEDIGEKPYRVDSMLNQLRLAGKLHRAAGFIVGNFKLDPDDEPEDGPSIEEVIRSYLLPLQKPALGGFLIGHCEPSFSVPLGSDCLLDADRKQLWLQPGVQ
ncbi:S66 peptidase family protein [Sporolactobacillus vineae]|uniref:S66 peptidase family protein n=1 Tax=Sporolactobacillus vineae TaxID=444463 RepID=UPI00028985E4|nr:LD-carboxypeptidase [Sporolactobacillus vineae]